MTTSPHPRVSLRDPGELIAAIPPLLGFRPADSLVLAVFTGVGEARLRLTLRADLPPPDLHCDLVDLANHLVTQLLQVESCAVTVVVVGGGTADPPWSLPQRELVSVLDKVFHRAGIQVVHALWVAAVDAGAGWRCYDEAYCSGAVPDPATTEVARAAEAAGVSTFDSREDMAATIAPDDERALDRRAAMLEKVILDDEVRRPGQALARGCGLLDELLGGGYAGRTELSDDQIVDLAVALSEPAVRDGCLGSAFGEHAELAERLWTELTRRVPPPQRAEPACLLAFAAYVRGDGAMAGMALERALEADPGHRLALLLRCALDTGFPPGEMRSLLARLEEDEHTGASPTVPG